ncbi:MAG: hypothetical protein KDD22_03930, partial [Bdellovibrionales bacterium]|nr:hypothetical protein [Bdellovibrionales bacterium]
ISTSSVAKYLQDKEKKETPPTLEEVKITFNDLSLLHKALLDYEYFRTLFAYMVDVNSIDSFKSVSESLKDFDHDLMELKSSFGKFMGAVQKFLSAKEAVQELEGFKVKVQSYRDQLNIYNECARVTNLAQSKILLGLDMESTDELFELRDSAEMCIDEYHWKGL